MELPALADSMSPWVNQDLEGGKNCNTIVDDAALSMLPKGKVPTRARTSAGEKKKKVLTCFFLSGDSEKTATRPEQDEVET